jgi:hypothetical protein
MFGVLALLMVAIGIPFLVVSTSAPLLQRWFAYTGHPSAADPYFLYAASNAGSLISLLGYPLVVEPGLTLADQAWVWAVGFVLLAVLVYLCGRAVKGPAVPEPRPAATKMTKKEKRQAAKSTAAGLPAPASQTAPATAPDPAEPTWGQKLRWVGLAFVPSSLMLGVTFHIATDIVSLPLLWVVPLALYLLTFIIAFGRTPGWFRPVLGNLGPVLTLLLVFCIMTGLPVIKDEDGGTDSGSTLLAQSAMHLVVYFFTALLMHSELARERPHPDFLTGYFLWISIGGVLGGVFNALIAPIVFTQGYEYPIAIAVGCLLIPQLAAAADGTWPGWWKLLAALLGGAVALVVLRLVYGPTLWVTMYPLLMAGLIAILYGSLILTGSQLERYRDWLPRALDFFFPLVMVAVFGALTVVPGRSEEFAEENRALAESVSHALQYAGLNAQIGPDTIAMLVVYALPCMLCFFHIDRPIRFGLCVAAILGVHYYRGAQSESVVASERSFFGIMRVEYKDAADAGVRAVPRFFYSPSPSRVEAAGAFAGGPAAFIEEANWEQHYAANTRMSFHYLYHGTTLHGIQAAEGCDMTHLLTDPKLLDMDGRPGVREYAAETFLRDEFRLLGAASGWDALFFAGAQKAWDLRQEPLTYYHRTGPVGEAFRRLRQVDPTGHVAMIGLGTGSVACYARPGQKLTFYEIDPTVINLVTREDRKYFTYTDDAKRRGAELEFVLGDARLKLEEQTDRKYALLLVDAFSSDSIPVHLLTKEALELYKNRLTEHGLLAIHISNRYVDLEPVLNNLAKETGLIARVWSDNAERYPGKTASSWVVLARTYDDLGMELAGDDTDIEEGQSRTLPKGRRYGADSLFGAVAGGYPWLRYHHNWRKLREFKELRTWTDDYTDVLAVMRLKPVKAMRKFFGQPVLPSADDDD